MPSTMTRAQDNVLWRNDCARQRPLVIGAGFQKTGTTTLGEMLVRLGWSRMCSPDTHWVPQRCTTIDSLKHVDAVEDAPWCCNESLLATAVDAYPCARVVLTLRDPEAWWASAQRWVLRPPPRPGKSLLTEFTRNLGIWPPVLDRITFIRRYEEHNEFVRSLFASGRRRSRFIEIDWTREESSQRLCAFLDVDVNSSTCLQTPPACRYDSSQEGVSQQATGGSQANISLAPHTGGAPSDRRVSTMNMDIRCSYIGSSQMPCPSHLVDLLSNASHRKRQGSHNNTCGQFDGAPERCLASRVGHMPCSYANGQCQRDIFHPCGLRAP